MAGRARALADELDRVNASVIAFTRELSDSDWELFVPNEERTVGVLIQHIAFGYSAEIDLICAVLTGKTIPAIYSSRTALDALNAKHAEELLAGTREAALQALRDQGAEASHFLRELSDIDLEQSKRIGLWGDAEVNVEFLIESIMLRHPITHMNSIRAALGQEPLAQPT